MFFLGGFNTILPHLLYLSLIWIFLLIGYSNRAVLSRQEKKLTFEKVIVKEAGEHQADIASSVFSDFFISGNESVVKKIDLCTPAFIPETTRLFSREPSVRDYRGPPFFIC